MVKVADFGLAKVVDSLTMLRVSWPIIINNHIQIDLFNRLCVALRAI